MLQACHELAARSWVANHDGNLSLRRPGRDFLVTPTAFRKADLRATDLLVIDAQGCVKTGRHKLFSEWQLHRAVFEARPEMNAVIHAHPPYSTAMACAGQRLDSCFMAEAIVSLGPEIGWVPFAEPGNESLTTNLSSVARRCNVALLAQHGVLSWGADLNMALARMELVEHLARLSSLAQSFGGVKRLPATSIAVMSAKHAKAGLAAPDMNL